MSYIGNRIRWFRKQKGISQEKLADKIGVHRQSIYKWEKGERVPDSDYIQKIARVLGVSSSDLLDPISFGRAVKLSGLSREEIAEKIGVDTDTLLRWENGEEIPPQKMQEKIQKVLDENIAFGKSTESNVIPFEAEKFKNVPIINHNAGAGEPFVTEGIDQEVEEYIPIPKELISYEKVFAFRVQGDSMVPEFKDGDIVVVGVTDLVPSGSIAVVQINGDALMIKQVYYYKNKKEVELRSFNPVYSPVRYPADEVHIIGKVILKIARY